MHHMAYPGSGQKDHQFEFTHPNPNSICVACGYQCLPFQGMYACKACNVPVHVECLTGISKKPVPLCFPSGPSWTHPVASVESAPPPPMLSSLSSTHPAYYAYNNPVPPIFPPNLCNHQGPLSHYAYNNPVPPMFPPYPYNHQGPPPQAPVMPTYPYPYPYPYNHQGNTQNTGTGNQQGNTQNTGNGDNQGKSSTGKKILKTMGRFAVPLMIASVLGVDLEGDDLPFLSEEDQSVG